MALRALEGELTSAVERLRVSVATVQRHSRRIRPGPGVEPDGSGSAIVLDARGLLLTNDHVVREAAEVHVRLDDGREGAAQIVGEDRLTDLALLQVPFRDLPAARFADSERLKVGQFVVAVGNSLGLPGGPTASVGVVSALGRPLPGADHIVEGLIQTDAAINPGNSGGPLADLDGAVVGVNAAMVPFAQGVGFAIPSNTVRHVVEELLRAGRVQRPWLGISAVGIDPGLARRYRLSRSRGILLAQVRDRGPAAEAGLRPGDILLRLGPRELSTLRDLLGQLNEIPLGGAVDFEYVRGGRVARGVVRVAEAPAAARAS
jgi:serine protease Do